MIAVRTKKALCAALFWIALAAAAVLLMAAIQPMNGSPMGHWMSPW